MIKHIKISNFRSIRECSVELNNINVLIGCNGVGKSNFIGTFDLLNNIYRQCLQNYVIEHAGAEHLLYNGSKNSDNIKCLFNFDNTNAFFFALKPTQDDSLYIDYSGDFFNNRELSEYIYDNWNKTIWDKSTKESSIRNSRYFRAFYVKKFIESFTVYHFHDTSSSSKLRKSCNIDDNMMLRYDASNLPAFLYWLQIKHLQNYQTIEAVVRVVAPYFKRFNLSPSKNNPDTIKLVWEEVNSDAYYDATNLSDGTLRFIALATLLLQPHLPQTIVIDEPELGLHPQAINILAGLIKKASASGTQVIIATQSVNLVNCFNPEDIIVADRINRQTVFSRVNTENLTSWLEDYSMGAIWEKNIIGG